MTVSINGDTGVSAVQSGAIQVSDIPDNTITPAKLTTQVQGALGTRNLIINGDMRIAQRGTSRVYSGTYNCIDRWAMGNYQAAGHEQVSVSNPALTAKTAIRVTSSSTAENSGGTRMTLGQMIESVNCSHLAGKTATLSFWVRFSSSSFPGSVQWSYQFSEYDAVDPDLRTTGATRSNATSIPNGSFPTEWTQYTKTITCGTNMKNLGARFENSNLINTTNNSDAWYEITQVQIEAGDTATPFEHRPYDMELARCQRYYYKISGGSQYLRFATGFVGAGSTTTLYCYFHPKVAMRATPTSIDWNNAIGAWNGGSVNSVSNITIESNGSSADSVNLVVTSSGLTASTPRILMGNNSSTASVAVSAEL